MSLLNNLLKDISKKYGDGTVALYGDLSKVEIKRVSCGLPSVDYILGGGIPEGRVIEIYGAQASGKTTLAIKFLSEVQKEYPDKRVAYIDVEHALDPEYAENLGLNMKEIIYVQPNNAEDALNIMAELVNSGEVKAIILDSVAQLIPKKELEGNIGDAEMGMRARLVGQALRKLTPIAEKHLCTLMFINQVRQNIGQTYGNPEVRPGGGALPFAASIILRVSNKPLDDLKGKTTIKVKKNKVGMPFKETELSIEFGKGYDVVQDIITTAMNMKVIERSGAFYSYGKKKWQGGQAMRDEIAKDNKLVSELMDTIKKKIGEDAVTVVVENIEPDITA